MLEHFYPEKKQENYFANKIFPDNYYSFKHRRVLAKNQRVSYLFVESESSLRSLLFDELKLYSLYDFTQFETQNPIVVDVFEDARETLEKEGEVKEEVEQEKEKLVVNEAFEHLKKTQSFEPDLTKLDL